MLAALSARSSALGGAARRHRRRRGGVITAAAASSWRSSAHRGLARVAHLAAHPRHRSIGAARPPRVASWRRRRRSRKGARNVGIAQLISSAPHRRRGAAASGMALIMSALGSAARLNGRSARLSIAAAHLAPLAAAASAHRRRRRGGIIGSAALSHVSIGSAQLGASAYRSAALGASWRHRSRRSAAAAWRVSAAWLKLAALGIARRRSAASAHQRGGYRQRTLSASLSSARSLSLMLALGSSARRRRSSLGIIGGGINDSSSAASRHQLAIVARRCQHHRQRPRRWRQRSRRRRSAARHRSHRTHQLCGGGARRSSARRLAALKYHRRSAAHRHRKYRQLIARIGSTLAAHQRHRVASLTQRNNKARRGGLGIAGIARSAHGASRRARSAHRKGGGASRQLV